MTDGAMASDAGAVVEGGDAAGLKAVSGDARPARACGACGRTFAGKAGRIVDGRPVCPACGNRLRPKVACGTCGRPTARPRREAGSDALICEGCLNRDTHATCCLCRKHRKVAARDAEGAPLCAGCATDAPTAHACPDCSEAVPGRGAAACDACSLKRLIGRRLAAHAALVEPAWARELYDAFCAWKGLPRNQYGVVRRADSYASCFAAISAGCTGPDEVIQTRLLALLGNEGMRRNLLVIRFLAGHLALVWDPAPAEDVAEQRRIEATLAANAEQPWAADLEAYRAYLDAGDVLPKTIRVYLTAAAGLLVTAAVTRAAELEQVHVRQRLRRTPGNRANLARFVRWVATIGGQDLSVGGRRKPNLRRRERTVLRQSGSLLAALGSNRDVRRGRALLAAAISRVYQLPLSRVLAIDRDMASLGADGSVVLSMDGMKLALTPGLAAAFRRYAAIDGPLAFPGSNKAQALSTAAVRHHTKGLDNGTIATESLASVEATA